MGLRIRTDDEIAQAKRDAERAANQPSRAERKRAAERSARRIRYAMESPEKRHAHREVARALAQGWRGFRRPDHCERCGKRCKPHAHHDDYSKPLDVRWLCPSCHSREHKPDHDWRQT